jgi:hypothetical protein
MSTLIKPRRAKRAKRPVKSASRKASANGSKHAGRARRDSETVEEFNHWLQTHAKEVGKWARENTKRLTGKEIL